MIIISWHFLLNIQKRLKLYNLLRLPSQLRMQLRLNLCQFLLFNSQSLLISDQDIQRPRAVRAIDRAKNATPVFGLRLIPLLNGWYRGPFPRGYVYKLIKQVVIFKINLHVPQPSLKFFISLSVFSIFLDL